MKDKKTPESDPTPWFAKDGRVDVKKHAPATIRNRDAIVDILRSVLPKNGLVLEVASGSGEHAIYFAEQFPGLIWQPSDPIDDACRSIEAWRAETEMTNIRSAMQLDAMADEWPLDQAAVILCINMIHISPWEATVGLFEKAASLLAKGAPLFLYGPYIRDGVETAPSNRQFDASLRSRDPRWGLRHLDDIDTLAEANGFRCDALVEMPANNLSLIFRKI